jgi:hypothetical protein
MRTTAVYLIVPSACLRALIVAMVLSLRRRAILVTYLPPTQMPNALESAEISQKRTPWKVLKK